jgi:hypothetical protein
VEERNRLAREVRSGGDRDTASWLAALRRPAPYVWALDQLARNDPERIRALITMGRRLADAQSRAVQDRAAAREMQDLNREVQRAVDDAVRSATATLRDAGHGATADTAMSMASTLRAVLTGDDDTRALLEQGRLLAPVVADFGFGGATATADLAGIVDPPPASAAATRKAARNAEPRDAAAQDRAAAAAAAEAAEDAEREVFQRKTDQRRADEAVAAARQQLQRLQDDLGRAEQEARDAAERVRDAVDAARRARRESDRLQSRLPG